MLSRFKPVTVTRAISHSVCGSKLSTCCQQRCLSTLSSARIPPFCSSTHNTLTLNYVPVPCQIQQVRCLFKIPNLNPLQKSSKKMQYTETRLLGYSMEQMFDIVADVGCYKEFIPWCRDSRMQKNPDGTYTGYMEVGFPPVIEGYHSNIKVVRPNLVLSICTEGRMFTHLVNEWRFTPGLSNNPKTCVLEFNVDFEFRSQLHSKLATVFFDEVVKTMVKAFLNRAKALYGPESIRPRKPVITETS